GLRPVSSSPSSDVAGVSPVSPPLSAQDSGLKTQDAPPPRDPEVALIYDFLTADMGLLQVASLNKMTLEELAEWATSPRTRRLIELLEQTSAIRARAIAAQSAPVALARLTKLAA